MCRLNEGASYIRDVSTVGHWAQRGSLQPCHISQAHRDSDAAVGEEIGLRIFSFVDYIWN